MEEADVPVEPTPDEVIQPTEGAPPAEAAEPDDVPLGTRPARGTLGRDRLSGSIRAKLSEVIAVYLNMAINKRKSESDVELVRTAAQRHRKAPPVPPAPLPAAGD